MCENGAGVTGNTTWKALDFSLVKIISDVMNNIERERVCMGRRSDFFGCCGLSAKGVLTIELLG